LHEAGLPPGVVNVVTNKPPTRAAVVGALIAHPAVRRINFTGSTAVGRIVARAASTSSPCCWSWAARRRWWCWTTPTWTKRSTPRPSGPS
jgi:acyl-CoA reductase-like NAD-dependent aldehyde dehydrogenase